MYFQILCQPMPAHNIIESIHIVRTFLREQRKIQQIDRNRRAELLICLPFAQGLIHPRPVVERALLHIVEVHQLNLYIDLTAVARYAVYVELRELVLLKLRIKFTVNKGDVRELFAFLAI